MTLEVWTTSAFRKSHFKMCHYHFQIIKNLPQNMDHDHFYFIFFVLYRRVCNNHQRPPLERGEHSADKLIEAFVSRIHFMVSTHSQRKTLPGTVQKNRSAFALGPDQNKYLKNLTEAHSFRWKRMESGLLRSIFCHLGATDGCDLSVGWATCDHWG